MKPNYDTLANAQAISRCLSTDVTFVGDSTVRQLLPPTFGSHRLWSASPNASDHHLDDRRHSDISIGTEHGRIQFIWDPYLNNTRLAGLRSTKANGSRDHSYELSHEHEPRSPKFVVVGGGLWHTRHLSGNNDSVGIEDTSPIYSAHLRDLLESRSNATEAEILPVFLPVQPPYHPWLDQERQKFFSPSRIKRMNNVLREVSEEYHYDVFWASIKMSTGPTAFQADGLHLKSFVAKKELEVLTTRLCPRMQDYTCCSKSADTAQGQVLILLAALVALIGSYLHRSAAARACAIMAATLVYCFCADRTMLFERVNKLVDPQLFVFFCFFALGAGNITTSTCSADELLCREQTQEWKGWMQIVILLYHYFGMSRVAWAYRAVRVLVAAYFLLTGYGHATYFIRTKDFSFRRVAAVLLRINLLSCILPFMMDTYYQFYYFPLLTSVWVMVTWATVPSELNWYSSFRIFYSAGATTIAYAQSDRFFRLLSRLGMMEIDVREFKFRFGLDLYAAFAGILLAVLMALRPDVLTLQRRATQVTTWTTVLLASACYLFHATTTDKETFNATHRYTSVFPILIYIFMRNAFPAWRSRYSRLFAWFGRHSLETFVLQYHIWLAADTHGILHLGLFDRGYTEPSTRGSWRFWTEVVLITTCFLWICSAVSRATGVMVKCVLGAPQSGDSSNEKNDELISHQQLARAPVMATRCPLLPTWVVMSPDQQMRWRVLVIVLGLYVLNMFWPWWA
jgi:N-acetylneuraminate 9-O-acetyltransferase